MKLTDKQIDTWRNTLVFIYGPFVLHMSDAQIETMAQAVQDRFNAELAVRRQLEHVAELEARENAKKQTAAAKRDKRLQSLADRVLEVIE